MLKAMYTQEGCSETNVYKMVKSKNFDTIFYYKSIQTFEAMDGLVGGSKVDSAFHSSEFHKKNTRISGDFAVKSKLSPHNGSVALRQLNPIHKKGP